MATSEGRVAVTVIVPVFNAEQYLDRCLESLSAQRFESVEFLCVDDGSTDSSAEILRRWADQEPRAEVIRTANGGPSAARNLAQAQARGDHLAFVDADDHVTEDYLEVLHAAALRDEADVVMGQAQAAKVSTGQLTRPSKRKPRVIDNRKAFTSAHLAEQITVHAKLFRRGFLQDNGIIFPVAGAYQDHAQWIHCLSRRPRISLLSEVLYTWSRNPESISAWDSMLDPARIASRFSAIEACLQHSETSGIRSLRERVASLQFNRYFVRHLLALADEEKPLHVREQAFPLLREGAAPHRDRIEEHTEGWQRLLYELLLQGSREDLTAVVRYLQGRAGLATEVKLTRRRGSLLRVARQALPSLPEDFPAELLEISPMEGLERRMRA